MVDQSPTSRSLLFANGSLAISAPQIRNIIPMTTLKCLLALRNVKHCSVRTFQYFPAGITIFIALFAKLCRASVPYQNEKRLYPEHGNRLSLKLLFYALMQSAMDFVAVSLSTPLSGIPSTTCNINIIVEKPQFTALYATQTELIPTSIERPFQ